MWPVVLFFWGSEKGKSLLPRRRGVEKGGEPKKNWDVLSHCSSRASRLRVKNLFNLIAERQTGSNDLVEVAGCCPFCSRSWIMFQVSRDAAPAIRGLRVHNSAGHLQDGCCSLGMVLPAGARTCQGLQDRQTRGRGSAGRVLSGDQRGRRDGPVGLSNKSSQWSLGDSLATAANRTATFGDTRRQLLGPQVGAGAVLCLVGDGRRFDAIHRKANTQSDLWQSRLSRLQPKPVSVRGWKPVRRPGSPLKPRQITTT